MATPTRAVDAASSRWLAAGEDADAVDGRRDRRFERWNRRQRGLIVRLSPRRIELVAPARLEPHAREVERARLDICVAPRERELILQAPQDEVVARDLGDDAHARIAQGRLAGPDVRARRLDISAHPAEQIELPQSVEAGLRGIELALVECEAG
jgi:hypothetical protein